MGAVAAAASTSASFSCCMSCGLPLVLGGIVCADDATSTCSSPQSRSTKKAAENVQKMSSGLNIHKKISVCNFTS